MTSAGAPAGARVEWTDACRCAGICPKVGLRLHMWKWTWAASKSRTICIGWPLAPSHACSLIPHNFNSPSSLLRIWHCYPTHPRFGDFHLLFRRCNELASQPLKPSFQSKQPWNPRCSLMYADVTWWNGHQKWLNSFERFEFEAFICCFLKNPGIFYLWGDNVRASCLLFLDGDTPWYPGRLHGISDLATAWRAGTKDPKRMDDWIAGLQLFPTLTSWGTEILPCEWVAAQAVAKIGCNGGWGGSLGLRFEDFEIEGWPQKSALKPQNPKIVFCPWHAATSLP